MCARSRPMRLNALPPSVLAKPLGSACYCYPVILKMRKQT